MRELMLELTECKNRELKHRAEIQFLRQKVGKLKNQIDEKEVTSV